MYYDEIIIGGGPSGMTAALYSLRAGRSVLIIEQASFGGQIATSPRVENYPSIKEISGMEFSANLYDQIEQLGAKFEISKVISIRKEEETFKVINEYDDEFTSKVVYIANGVKHRTTGISEEEEFIGNGISYCATCDGAFYKDQDVMVIGDANTALQYSLLLSTYCKSVTIITLFDKFFAEKSLIEKIKNRSNIKYFHNLKISGYLHDKESIIGATFIDTTTNEKRDFSANGIFVAIGQVPNNEIFKELVDLENGYIVVDDKLETKTKGLFAIGDTRKKDVRQLVTACSDGATASVAAEKYFN